MQAALQHRVSEVDAVGDIRRQDQDVRLNRPDLVEHGGPVGGVRIVDHVGHHRDALALRLLVDRGSDGRGVSVQVVNDR